MPHITRESPHESLMTALRAELAPSQLALKATQDELLASQVKLQAAVRDLSSRRDAAQTGSVESTLRTHLAASQDILHSAESELATSLTLMTSARKELTVSQSKLRAAEDELERLRNVGGDRLAARESDAAGSAEPADEPSHQDIFASADVDIQAPLRTVLEWSQQLKQGESSSEELLEGIHVLGRVAQAQAKLIDELLGMRTVIASALRGDTRGEDLALVLEGAMRSVNAFKRSNPD